MFKIKFDAVSVDDRVGSLVRGRLDFVVSKNPLVGDAVSVYEAIANLSHGSIVVYEDGDEKQGMEIVFQEKKAKL